jgi:nucleotidyltransferase substrate binding protein (TIGR01987 family)
MNKQHVYGTINYTSLINARNFLNEILQNARNDYEKTGAIQAFEFCYELSWRIMKKILIFHGVEVTTARNAFREAAKLNLLTDAERWFAYLEKRNITVHSYRKEILDDLFSNTAKEFLIDLDYLLNQLAKQAPNYDPTRK